MARTSRYPPDGQNGFGQYDVDQFGICDFLVNGACLGYLPDRAGNALCHVVCPEQAILPAWLDGAPLLALEKNRLPR